MTLSYSFYCDITIKRFRERKDKIKFREGKRKMAINRADLINQLAASMGAGEYATSTTVRPSRFDSKTGTLYCKEKRISQDVADIAIKHFTLLKNRCLSTANNPETKQLAQIYECAIESIKMMQDPQVKALLSSASSSKRAV